MGPRARYLGPEVPAEMLIWQDPVPAVDHTLVDAKDVADLKAKVLASGLSFPELVSAAWASASTFRGSDMRGGANGAHIRLSPQKDWEVNQPAQLAKVLSALEGVKKSFNAASRHKRLARRSHRDRRLRRDREGGGDAGLSMEVPFTPGRTDATQEQTDIESFAVLEPVADGFRNYQKKDSQGPAGGDARRQGAIADADRARDDGARRRPARARRQFGGSQHGVFTKRPGALTNDFFVNLLDMGTAGSRYPKATTCSKAATVRRAN